MSRDERQADEADEATPLLASVIANDGQETQVAGVERALHSSSGRQIAPDLLRGLLMALMAIDHLSQSMGAYAHGTGVDGEETSKVITEWNSDLAYTLRTLTHLCAPGFTMLLGMGVAYFTTSRLSQGLQPLQFIKHFTLRALAIIIVNQIAFVQMIFTPPYVYILNVVLWMLAINYLVVGGLSVLFAFVFEPRLAQGIKAVLPTQSNSSSTLERRAEDLARHALNAFLLVASTLLLWSTVWTAPNQGDCRSTALTTTSPATTMKWPDVTVTCKLDRHLVYSLLFKETLCSNLHLFSNFPPVEWLSFALFGFLYGRIIIRGHFKKPLSLIAFNAAIGVTFALLFLSTRLLSYGNATSHCLATPDQLRQHPQANQYLASLKSFFYIAKYPPSPAFAFFALSICFLLLALFTSLLLDNVATSKWIRSRFNPLLVYGNQSLFFYGAHMLLLHLVAIPVMNSPLAKPQPDWSNTGKGIGLGWPFFVIYFFTLVVMYFACLSYSRFKAQSGRESVWRFL